MIWSLKSVHGVRYRLYLQFEVLEINSVNSTTEFQRINN